MTGDDDAGAGYELVMPFVVCVSKGGPFDDEAFVAGYSCGQINQRLETRRQAVYEDTVRTAIVPQLDLIAMRHGYALEHEPWEEGPEWSFVRFRRQHE